MKQIVQYFNNGETVLLEVPVPNINEYQILIKTSLSLISSGTEKMLIEFGKGNLLQKVKQQPEKVKTVLQKTKTDGLLATYDAVKNKIEQPISMGYCNVGEVIKVGNKVKGFKKGDRVVSNGNHAEYVVVTENLCALIPNEVSNEKALFTVLCSIGLNGIRLAKPTFGETFLVSGLGIIGLLTAQILKNNGCNVIGIDIDREKCNLAESYGIKSLQLTEFIDSANWCLEQNNDLELDGVLITASTKSNQPIELATKVTRKGGRIILIGQSGLNINRNEFYKKELSFQVSCSYGPGRYDKNYEEYGNDYPISFVRWTEKRNFEAILNALKSDLIITKDLISHKFEFNKAVDAYELLRTSKSSLGIVLIYESEKIAKDFKTILNSQKIQEDLKTNSNDLSFLGAGNYTGSFLIPSFKKAGANFKTIAASTGLNATFLGKKYNFDAITTDLKNIFNDESRSIVISTRHDSHAKFTLEALSKGKNVFLEKPLCLTRKELDEISNFNFNNQILMVGFNRRFSPLIQKVKTQLEILDSPKTFIYTCNAGKLIENHWLKDPKIGGGRLIGEACHFVDLLRYLTSSKIEDLKVFFTNDSKESETFTIQVCFSDGSIGSIHYFANGNRNFPKERLEIFCSESIFQIDNFRKLNILNKSSKKSKTLIRQDKGQDNCTKSFLKAVIESSKSPIPINELFEVQDFLLRGINL